MHHRSALPSTRSPLNRPCSGPPPLRPQVGNHMLRGISGGQKKRVTGGEMLVGPAKVRGPGACAVEQRVLIG